MENKYLNKIIKTFQTEEDTYNYFKKTCVLLDKQVGDVLTELMGQYNKNHELKKEFLKKIFKSADEQLNYSISKIILEGPENELKLTKNTQPAIQIISHSIFKVINEEFNIKIKYDPSTGDINVVKDWF